MNQNIIAKASGIIKSGSVQGGDYQGQICTLSLIDAEGFPTAPACALEPRNTASIWLAKLR